ncbi:hypothetical protein M0638_27615 [Roseomonas sp. NAR14]|uniref:Uncharacterized protein n=1 Tax=Roseomonas acroporae TaxID=2937791 RepID=A0A9X2BWT1_9PROT|nr:hypothetical protein [Roseomonas acroporae]MCK8788128.1 hypothetical protein [Roseomonas acroporae]
MLATLCRAVLAICRTRSTVADLIENDPAGWAAYGKYRIRHGVSGVAVWIGNDAYGLHVEIDGEEWKPSAAERRLIWQAVKTLVRREKRLRERRVSSSIERAIARATNGEPAP